MSDSPQKDPFSDWREMLGQMERTMNAAANEFMAKDEFSKAMNEAMAAKLQTQRGIAEKVSEYLVSINVPTRDDINALAVRLIEIQKELTAVSAAIQRMEGKGPAEIPPPSLLRTKRFQGRSAPPATATASEPSVVTSTPNRPGGTENT